MSAYTTRYLIALFLISVFGVVIAGERPFFPPPSLNNDPVFSSSPKVTVRDNEQYEYIIVLFDQDKDITSIDWANSVLPGWMSHEDLGMSVPTIAGSSQGYRNGTGAESLFNWPKGMVEDSDGNIFVSDENNHIVRKISPDGQVTTVVGGEATSVQLNTPRGLVLDADGNLYIADHFGHSLWKATFDASGNATVILIAGGNGKSNIDGPVGTSGLRFPSDLVIQGDYLYFTDKGNNSIRRVDLRPGNNYTTSWFSGGPGQGYKDGPANEAKFRRTLGIDVDADGNFIVVDRQNDRIRRVAPDGSVTTIAGGSQGYQDGPALEAKFHDPEGLLVDIDGSIYVADDFNNKVRRIAFDEDGQAGVMTVTDGGYDMAENKAFSFNRPSFLMRTNSGDLLVSDADNHRIRKIEEEKRVFRLYGNSYGHVGSHNIILRGTDGNGGNVEQAFTLTVSDANPNLLSIERRDGYGDVVEGGEAHYTVTFNEPVSNVSPDDFITKTTEGVTASITQIIPVPGEGGRGPNVYHVVMTGISGSGTLSVQLSAGNNIVDAGGNSYEPKDLLGEAGYYYVHEEGISIEGDPVQLPVEGVDYEYVFGISGPDNDKINLSASSIPAWATLNYLGGNVETFSGSGRGGLTDGPKNTARFSNMGGIARDSDGNLYVAQSANNRSEIRKVSTDGSVSTIYNTTFNTRIVSVAVDNSGNVYFAEYYGHRIRKIDSGGTVTVLAGPDGDDNGPKGYKDGPAAEALFDGPFGLCVDEEGNVFVAESNTNHIRKISVEGMVSTVAGSGRGYQDGVGLNAKFRVPTDVAVDKHGTLYVADRGNRRIRKILPNGEVSTLTGTGGDDVVDGDKNTAMFKGPNGIDIDKQGNIYVADYYGHVIRKVSPTGVVTTIGGKAVTSGFQDSEKGESLFKSPFDVVVDDAGALYVSDRGNVRVRKIHEAQVYALRGDASGVSAPETVTIKAENPHGYTAEQTFDIHPPLSTLYWAGPVDSDESHITDEYTMDWFDEKNWRGKLGDGTYVKTNGIPSDKIEAVFENDHAYNIEIGTDTEVKGIGLGMTGSGKGTLLRLRLRNGADLQVVNGFQHLGITDLPGTYEGGLTLDLEHTNTITALDLSQGGKSLVKEIVFSGKTGTPGISLKLMPQSDFVFPHMTFTGSGKFGGVEIKPAGEVTATLEKNSSVAGNFFTNENLNFSLGDYDLDLYNNWDGDAGTFTAGTGSVRFVGNIDQSVSDAHEIPNVTLAKGSSARKVTLHQQLRINRTLELERGTLVIPNGIYLDADEDKYAIIPEIAIPNAVRIRKSETSSNNDGILTMKRVFGKKTERELSQGWMRFGPVLNGQIFGDWKSQFHMYMGAGNSSVNLFDEKKYGDYKTDVSEEFYWTGVFDPTTAITAGLGYSIYVYGKNLVDGTLTFEENGTLPKGNISIKTRYSGTSLYHGFNLVANPYPCPISWDKLLADQNDPSLWHHTAYVWDSEKGTYRFLKDNTNGGDYVDNTDYDGHISDPDLTIAPGQAFLVYKRGGRVNQNNSIVFKESSKVNVFDRPLFRTESNSSESDSEGIVVELRGPSGQSLPVALGFDDRASAQFDLAEDDFQMSGSETLLAILAKGTQRDGTKNKSVEARLSNQPFPAEDSLINISFGTAKLGPHKLEFGKYRKLKESRSIKIIDQHLKDTVDMLSVDSYAFEVNSDQSSYASDRFKIWLGNKELMNRVYLDFGNVKAGEGRLVNIPVRAKDFKKMKSLDMDLNWDKSVFSFENVITKIPGQFDLDKGEIGSGKIGIEWRSVESDGLSLQDGDTLFLARYRVTDDAPFQSEFEMEKLSGQGLTLKGDKLVDAPISGGTGNVIIRQALKVKGEVRDKSGSVAVKTVWQWSLDGEEQEPVTGSDQHAFRPLEGEILGLRPKVSTTDSKPSVLDLVKIRRSILGTYTFSDALDEYASDLDGNGKVSTADIGDLREVILGLRDDSETDWKVLTEESVQKIKAGDWEDLTHEVNALVKESDEDRVYSFTAVRKGSVGEMDKQTRSQGRYLHSKPWKTNEDGTQSIELYCDTDLSGLQFSLAWESGKYELAKWENLANGNLQANVKSGVANILWNETFDSKNANQPILRLTYRSKNQGSELPKIALAEKGVEALAVDQTLNPFSVIGLNIEGMEDGPVRFSASPNPFRDMVTFRVPSGTGKSVKVKMFDLRGALIDSFARIAETDYPEIEWKPRANGVRILPGTYIYKVKSDGKTFEGQLMAK
ncbi:hypothetical protein FUAX_47210 (plasmid) [Fulvitalea axinellae]|uniref:NHL repeat-containing protein n=1 Tax=Fulvitalea axinellae TaxID=1182444 RepID=A0AAU9DCU2_9BACT|nr:hypothetical protein FUAX_47210 [Fulvitalea axinellae]